VYVSFDDGEQWQRFDTNLPIAPIHDLHLHGSDLIASTHGRSLWILDDVTALHQMADAAKEPAYLFKPRQTVRFKQYHGYGMKPHTGVSYRMAGPVVYGYKAEDLPNGEKRERLLDAGENPPEGVIVHYALKAKPEGDITLRFLDASGALIKEFSSKEEPKPAEGEEKPKDEMKDPRLMKEPGTNRFVWNMRYPDATKVPDNKGRSGTEELVAGPVAAPGTYQMQLAVDGATYTQSFEIVKDPRVAATLDDLKEQFELGMKIRNKVSETHETILRIRDLREQAEGWAKRSSNQAVKDAAKALKDELTAIESELVQVKSADPRSFPSKLNSRLAVMSGFVESADSAPPQQFHELYADLAARIDAQLARLKQLIAEDVAAFNKVAHESKVEAIA